MPSQAEPRIGTTYWNSDHFPPDPLMRGLSQFAEGLRNGTASIEGVTSAYLERIRFIEPEIRAFEVVTDAQALSTARALDQLLRAGVDLGPLMGVPVAIKDVIAVSGIPTTAGSYLDVSDIIGEEGPFIRALKSQGCIILGKTKTAEFALGVTRTWRGTPKNPADPNHHRTPGGSSSGSAAAMAAGMCGFAVGTDTSGSVRIPAALCGAVGLKTSAGLWRNGGIFPLSRSFDTVGLVNRTAADCAFAFAALQGIEPIAPAELSRLILGIPGEHFFRHVSPEILACFDASVHILQHAGVKFVPFEFPEASVVTSEFPIFSPAEQMAIIGRERFERIKPSMDPTVARRLEASLDFCAEDYIRIMWLREALVAQLHSRMDCVHGILCPTVPLLPPLMDDVADDEVEANFHKLLPWNTRPASVLGLCALTVPIHRLENRTLPVGLQITCPPNRESFLLSIGQACERAFS